MKWIAASAVVVFLFFNQQHLSFFLPASPGYRAISVLAVSPLFDAACVHIYRERAVVVFFSDLNPTQLMMFTSLSGRQFLSRFIIVAT